MTNEQEPTLPDNITALETKEKEHFSTVEIYSIVTIQEEGYPQEDVIQIIPVLEKENPEILKNIYYVSDKSPLGSALLGKKEKDKGIVHVKGIKDEPDNSFTVKVIHINNSEVLNRS